MGAVNYLGCVHFNFSWVWEHEFDGINLRQVTHHSGSGVGVDVVHLMEKKEDEKKDEKKG